MDRSTLKQTLQLVIRRYRYAVLILLAGLGLMLIPSGKPVQQAPGSQAVSPGLEAELAGILSKMEGAGRVEVLLTEKTGAQIHYQTDRRTDTGESGGSEQLDTVLLEEADRSRSGLIQRKDPPQYLGALIVCQGGGDPQVRLRVVRAVRCVTGLRSDQIQVVKMK